jgi:hypothetical protein
VEEVEHVAAAPARAARDLRRVGERVHERQVLTQRVDHLDRQTDAGRARLREQARVGVAIDARGGVPLHAVAAAADHEQRLAVHAVDAVERAADPFDAGGERAPRPAEDAVRADVRDPQRRAAQEPDRALGAVGVELAARLADRAEADPLEVVDVILELPAS